MESDETPVGLTMPSNWTLVGYTGVVDPFMASTWAEFGFIEPPVMVKVESQVEASDAPLSKMTVPPLICTSTDAKLANPTLK